MRTATKDEELQLFQSMRPGSKVQIYFYSKGKIEFYPLLCGEGFEFGYELNAFMDVSLTDGDSNRCDVYIQCIGFLTFLKSLIQGLTGSRLIFLGLYDVHGSCITTDEDEATLYDELRDENDDDEKIDERLAQVSRIVYEIR